MRKFTSQKVIGGLLVLGAPIWMLAAAFVIKAQTFPFIELEEVGAEYFARPADWNYDIMRLWAETSPGPIEVAREVALLTREEFADGEAVVLTDWRQPLEAEEPLRALCSEYAKFFVATCRERGLRARVVWMQGHTTAEVYDGERYVVADPNGNLVLREKSDGEAERLLGITDLAAGAEFEPEHLLEPEAGGGDDPNFIGTRSMWVYDRPELAVEIDEADLFSFHLRTRDPRVLLRYLLGGEPPARGRVLGEGRGIPVGGGRAAAWIGFAAMALQAALGAGLFWRGRSRAVETG